MELAKPRPHHHPFRSVCTFTFTTCQVTAPLRFCWDFQRTMGAQAHICGHELFYTVLLTSYSFIHNKRCRRSNYSVKPICSRGDAAARYQLKQKEVCVTLPAIPKLLSKISHFHVISIELLPGIHMHTVTKSCCMPKPLCHIRYSCTSLVVLINHNVIPDLWLLWHIACSRLEAYCMCAGTLTPLPCPFKSSSRTILNFSAPFFFSRCCKEVDSADGLGASDQIRLHSS